jgi:hypothetical protein
MLVGGSGQQFQELLLFGVRDLLVRLSLTQRERKRRRAAAGMVGPHLETAPVLRLT